MNNTINDDEYYKILQCTMIKCSSDITIEEIRKDVRSLQNEKVFGIDLIVPIMRIYQGLLAPVYRDNVNAVFITGNIPDTGVTKTVFKKKGNTLDPNSYRLITIFS